MRKLVTTACLMLATTMSFADRDDSREIQDLMYLPEAKTFYGVTTLDLTAASNDFDSGDQKLKERTFTQQIGYAFTDRFTLFVELFERASNLDTNNDSGTDELAKRNGIGNPIIGAKWRALDQRVHDVNVDVIPLLSVKIGTPETPGTNGDGNNIEGTSYGMEAQVGKKFSKDEFYTYFRLMHHTTYFADDQTTDEENEFDIQNDYDLGARYQRSVTDYLFFNATLGYKTSDSTKRWVGSSNANYVDRDALHTYYVGIESIITPYPNLALALALDMSRTKDYSEELTPGGKVDYERNRSRTISLWTRYQF